MGDTYSLDGFWDFVVERHAIWHRKVIQRNPPPWTDDQILRTYFFCNVFRDLDRGTGWYKHWVARPEMRFSDLLWRTIVYRLVNNTEIFERLGGGVPPREEWEPMIATLRQEKILLNSQAYLTFPWPHVFKGIGSRTSRFEYILQQLDLGFDSLVFSIEESKTLEEVSFWLKLQYGIGPLVSMQIYRDLLLAGRLKPFTDDDWAEVGVGIKKTMLGLFGPQARSDGLMQRMMHEIRASQMRPLSDRGFYDFETRRISLCDIENCLCEYRKYVELAAGRGRKRYYNARV